MLTMGSSWRAGPWRAACWAGAALLVALAVAGPRPAAAAGGTAKPTIACVPADATQASVKIRVCAGADGARRGFVLRWKEGQPGDVWPTDRAAFCVSRFATEALGHWLKKNECLTVTIGELLATQSTSTKPPACLEALQCGKTYGFSARALPTPTKPASAFSKPGYCATLPCRSNGQCTYTQGYWKTHGPVPKGNNAYTWPAAVQANGLDLGAPPFTYAPAQLLAIFNKAPAGNGLLTLAHQLIAAKLNIANGADGSAIAATSTAADMLIGARVVPPTNGSTAALTPASLGTLVTALTNDNEGRTGPGHCR